MAKVWFITGASDGLGRKCAEVALKAGERVAVAARRDYLLDDLSEAYGADCLPLKLDVTDADGVKAAVDKALTVFGRIDVLVNNAGIGYYASVEELFYSRIDSVMKTNFYGSLSVIQAMLPCMRARKSGHIIQITSLGGVLTFPLMGAYGASKWALEGLLETLSMEVGEFGIKVTMVEPGPFATGFHEVVQYEQDPLPAYDHLMREHWAQMRAVKWEDPEIAARGVMRLAALESPPLRATAGTGMLELVRRAYAQRLAEWAVLEDL